MPDRSILDHPELPAGRTVAYGPRPHHVYEVVGDEHAGRGWVVLVHGGFWKAEWDRTHLRPLAAALARDGYAVALLEYARAGMAGGGFPGTFDDVRAALAAVRREAGTAPLVLAGHSAGGHLAVWLLHQPEAEGVAGAVSLAGCLDLTLTADLGLGGGAAAALMGGGPGDRPELYPGADPSRLGAAPYPVVVVHGTADEAVPLTVAESWWSACATEGRDRLVVLEGVSHFPLVDPGAPCHGVVREHLARLLAARQP